MKNRIVFKLLHLICFVIGTTCYSDDIIEMIVFKQPTPLEINTVLFGSDIPLSRLIETVYLPKLPEQPLRRETSASLTTMINDEPFLGVSSHQPTRELDLLEQAIDSMYDVNEDELMNDFDDGVQNMDDLSMVLESQSNWQLVQDPVEPSGLLDVKNKLLAHQYTLLAHHAWLIDDSSAEKQTIFYYDQITETHLTGLFNSSRHINMLQMNHEGEIICGAVTRRKNDRNKALSIELDFSYQVPMTQLSAVLPRKKFHSSIKRYLVERFTQRRKVKLDHIYYFNTTLLGVIIKITKGSSIEQIHEEIVT